MYKISKNLYFFTCLQKLFTYNIVPIRLTDNIQIQVIFAFKYVVNQGTTFAIQLKVLKQIDTLKTIEDKVQGKL